MNQIEELTQNILLDFGLSCLQKLIYMKHSDRYRDDKYRIKCYIFYLSHFNQDIKQQKELAGRIVDAYNEYEVILMKLNKVLALGSTTITNKFSYIFTNKTNNFIVSTIMYVINNKITNNEANKLLVADKDYLADYIVGLPFNDLSLLLLEILYNGDSLVVSINDIIDETDRLRELYELKTREFTPLSKSNE